MIHITAVIVSVPSELPTCIPVFVMNCEYCWDAAGPAINLCDWNKCTIQWAPGVQGEPGMILATKRLCKDTRLQLKGASNVKRYTKCKSKSI